MGFSTCTVFVVLLVIGSFYSPRQTFGIHRLNPSYTIIHNFPPICSFCFILPPFPLLLHLQEKGEKFRHGFPFHSVLRLCPASTRTWFQFWLWVQVEMNAVSQANPISLGEITAGISALRWKFMLDVSAHCGLYQITSQTSMEVARPRCSPVCPWVVSKSKCFSSHTCLTVIRPVSLIQNRQAVAFTFLLLNHVYENSNLLSSWQDQG